MAWTIPHDLRTQLEAANAGRTAVDSRVASEFESRKGILGTIMAKVDPDVGVACNAYGLGEAVISVSPAPVDPARAQQILDDMRQEVGAQSIAMESVTFACAAQEALSEI